MHAFRRRTLHDSRISPQYFHCDISYEQKSRTTLQIARARVAEILALEAPVQQPGPVGDRTQTLRKKKQGGLASFSSWGLRCSWRVFGYRCGLFVWVPWKVGVCMDIRLYMYIPCSLNSCGLQWCKARRLLSFLLLEADADIDIARFLIMSVYADRFFDILMGTETFIDIVLELEFSISKLGPFCDSY